MLRPEIKFLHYEAHCLRYLIKGRLLYHEVWDEMFSVCLVAPHKMQLSNTSNTHKFSILVKGQTHSLRCESAGAAPPLPTNTSDIALLLLSWVLSDPQWNQTLSDSDQQQKRDSAFLRRGGNQPRPAGRSGYRTACSKGGEYSSRMLSASLWRSRNPHCNLSAGRPAGSCPLPAVSRRLSWEPDCWRHWKLSCPWQEICTESRKCTQTCT